MIIFRENLINILARLFSYFSRFLLIFIIINKLDIKEFSQYGLISATVIWLYQIFGLEFHQYTSRILTKLNYNRWGQILINSFYLYLLSFSFLGLSLIFLKNYISLYFDFILLIFLITFFELLLIELIRIHYISGNSNKYNLLEFSRRSSLLILLIIQLLFNVEINLKIIIYDWLIILIFNLFLCLNSIKKYNILISANDLKLDKLFLKKGIKISSFYFISLIFSNSIFTLDRYLINFNFDSKFLAAYILFISICLVPENLITGLFFSKYFNQLVKASNNLKKFKKLFSQVFLKIIILLIIFDILFVLTIEKIIDITGKKILLEYINLSFFVLIIGNLVSIRRFFDFTFHAKSLDNLILKSNIILFITFIILNYFFYQFFNEIFFLITIILSFLISIIFYLFRFFQIK